MFADKPTIVWRETSLKERWFDAYKRPWWFTLLEMKKKVYS
jgi:hypothetical protein